MKSRWFVLLLMLFLFGLGNAVFASNFPDYATEFTGVDKWEKFNRKIFNFNIKANKYVIRPINILWASIMPQYGIDRLQNFYTNINYPDRLVSSLIQKDFKTSKTETARFFINLTVGLAGLYDPAQSVFKIEPRKEDMAQALAYRHVKQGPYVVLPIVAQGNMRDIGGYVLDIPFNPTSYLFFIGPASMICSGVSTLNDTTIMQPITKMADSYVDPYPVSRQFVGIDRYIKNKNIERYNFLDEKSPNTINVSQIENTSGLKADIVLKDYTSQGALVDSMRTMYFDSQKTGKSIWSELSLWNRTFSKRIKTASVNVIGQRPKYKYRYILQKEKTAPVAILYPSIGEDINSKQSEVLAKVLYDEGYSVIIQGSAFQWGFVKSMPEGYKPGLPYQDAYFSSLTTSRILNDLKNKQGLNPNKKIIVGSSFGALTTLFVAQQEEKGNSLNISKYIVINPPIEIFYALKQLDKYCEDWKNSYDDIKVRAAVTTEKVLQVTGKVESGKLNYYQPLPLNKGEAELAMGFVMKQKLSDVIFTVEGGTSKNPVPDELTKISFYDYGQKYLMPSENKSLEQLNYDASLYALENFLKKNNKYKIYHSLDDCFVSQEQLIWLKKITGQAGEKSLYFSNGSHLGYLYRIEFLNEFKKDIKIN